jgi:hypothetical protein
MKRNDNRGSSILMVILVAAGIGVMAAIALWVSLRNVQMKTTDAEIKESFYSAEGVLEQVKAGVKEKAEAAYKEAVTKDLENFAKYGNSSQTPAGAASSTVSEKARRAEDFKKNFKDTFKSSIDRGTAGEYNIKSISNLVDQSLLNSPTYPYAVVSAMNGGFSRDEGILKDEDDKLVLKGIKVRYVSEDEQVSEIVTDITVAVPKPDVVSGTSDLDLFEYAIIGDKGVEVIAGNVDIKGSVYAGFDGSLNKQAFVAKSYTNVGLYDKTLIANGTVYVAGNASLKASPNQKIWAGNILLDGGRAELTGASYVADDLTLSGVRSSAKISGTYKGYGDDKNVASSSSAIIINGKDSSIDMSGAKEVALAGYSYIATGNERLRDNSIGEARNNKDIKMGESIAVKGNQIAYLMPGEWIGTDSNKESKFGHNPLSYDEYNKLLNEKDSSGKNYVLVDTKARAYKTGKTFEDYGVTKSDLDANYTKIFVQPITGISSDGLVYFYVNLPQDKAAKYFNDFYAADKNRAEELKKHTDYYTGTIKSAAEANIKTVGNYTLYDNDLVVLPGKTSTIDNTGKFIKTFRALCTNLTTKVKAGQRENEVFKNIINEAVLNGYLAGVVQKEVSVNGVKAVITSGNYDYNSSSGDVRLIVANGDVTVKRNFTGTIIANGKVTVNSAGEIKSDDSGIIKNLISEPLTAGGSDYFYRVFKDGEAFAASGSTVSGNDLFADGSVDLSKLVSYSNWKKK